MARVCKYGLSWVWTAKPRAFCVLWVATILCSFKLHRQECLLILRRFLRVCLCLRKLVTECLLAVDSGGDIVRKKKKASLNWYGCKQALAQTQMKRVEVLSVPWSMTTHSNYRPSQLTKHAPSAWAILIRLVSCRVRSLFFFFFFLQGFYYG